VLARGGAIIRKECTCSDDSRRVTLGCIDLVKVEAVVKKANTLSVAIENMIMAAWSMGGR
jgi:hypothetical protein